MSSGKKRDNRTASDEIISHRHDKFFRAALENLTVARELLETHLPPGIKELVQFDSLKPEPDSFISKSLSKSICDVLFSAKIHGGTECLFLLIEAQSKPDKWMALRLMKYMLSICSRYLKHHKGAARLPLVYPIVIYNGQQNYDVTKNFWDLFILPKLVKKIWTEDHLVINVHKIPDEELLQRIWGGSLQWMLKHIFDPNLIQSCEQMKGVIGKLAAEGNLGINYLELIMHYALTGIEKNDKLKLEKLLKTCLKQESEVHIMGSLAKHWLDEGIEKGIEKGKEEKAIEIAREMLHAGIDIVQTAKFSKLKLEQVKMLANETKGEAAS
jgi:predicted transposase YdaD